MHRGADQERRRTFRIRDQVILDYRTADQSQTLDTPPEQTEPPSPPPLFHLMAQLTTMEQEQHLLQRVTSMDKNLASYLRMLNRKIDMVAQLLVTSELQHGAEPQPVTLSEGGLSFLDLKPLTTDQRLQLQLTLLPSGVGLLLNARVVYSRKEEEIASYRTGMAFVDLDDRQKHLLARHIIDRQAEARRRENQSL